LQFPANEPLVHRPCNYGAGSGICTETDVSVQRHGKKTHKHGKNIRKIRIPVYRVFLWYKSGGPRSLFPGYYGRQLAAPALGKIYRTIHQGKEGIVPSAAHIDPRMYFGSPLPGDNGPRPDGGTA
jgi:hypothetical protein